MTTPFREFEVSDSGEQRRLVWLGLQVAGMRTANDLVAKVLQVVGAIRGRRDAQALVLSAGCEADCNEARAQLSRFAGSAAELMYARAEEAISPP
jgi:hypothetical protein